ncbi:hypothetical protein [Devosia sediminis]|uniref:Uncharacterized protein n=1 Tax=Devosia sediminis TaxID=2798801 RepID=A0A934MHN1_9HYPH|nr:hypothetical protein [Devosia sediminis]MBJ3785282.1 hypothetical protein [Devosia sediminis]
MVDVLSAGNSAHLAFVFQRLLSKLEATSSAIHIGLAHVVARNATVACRTELHEAIYSQLETLLGHVDQYLSNFPDWRAYQQDAIDDEVSDAMAAELADIAKAIVERGKELSSLLTDEAVLAIADVSTMGGDRGVTEKHSIVSTLLNFGTAGSSLVFGLAKAAIAGIAVASLTGLLIWVTELLATVPQFAWLRPVADQLKNLPF